MQVNQTEPLAVESKRCPGCGCVKHLTEFHRDKGRPDGRNRRCRGCVNADQRAYQQAYKAEHGDYATRKYRYDRICEGCGESFTNRESKARFCSKACSNRTRSMSHTCAACGHVWESGRTGGRFCSDECRDMHQRAALAQIVLHSAPIPRAEFLAATRILPPLRKRWYAGQCLHCGAWFIHDQPQTVTCTTRCARKIGKAKRRAVLLAAFVAPVSRRKIFERDGWRCQLCGKPVKRDAVVPHPLAPTIDHIVPVRPPAGAPKGTHEPANVHCAHYRCNNLKNNRGGGEQLLLIG